MTKGKAISTIYVYGKLMFGSACIVLKHIIMVVHIAHLQTTVVSYMKIYLKGTATLLITMFYMKDLNKQ